MLSSHFAVISSDWAVTKGISLATNASAKHLPCQIAFTNCLFRQLLTTALSLRIHGFESAPIYSVHNFTLNTSLSSKMNVTI